MRRSVLYIAVVAVLLGACRERPSVASYWASRSLDISDIRASEEEFAEFAELAVSAPVEDAIAGIDLLLDRVSSQPVTYYVYSQWLFEGFGSLLSPCHSDTLFVYAADRIVSEGIMDGYERELFLTRREYCLHNRVGMRADIPRIYDREYKISNVPLVQKTLFLVVDQACPSCVDAMTGFISPQWADTWLIALCVGRGPLPVEPGWDCFFVDPEQVLFDPSATPFYFVTAPDGTVETGYTLFKK